MGTAQKETCLGRAFVGSFHYRATISYVGLVECMRGYVVKTVKVGDAVVIALPKELLAAEQISGDMVVKVTVQKCQKGLVASKEKKPSGDDDPWRLLE